MTTYKHTTLHMVFCLFLFHQTSTPFLCGNTLTNVSTADNKLHALYTWCMQLQVHAY